MEARGFMAPFMTPQGLHLGTRHGHEVLLLMLLLLMVVPQLLMLVLLMMMLELCMLVLLLVGVKVPMQLLQLLLGQMLVVVPDVVSKLQMAQRPPGVPQPILQASTQQGIAEQAGCFLRLAPPCRNPRVDLWEKEAR